MIESAYHLARDLGTLVIGAAITLFALRSSWKQFSPLLLPALRWLRDSAIEDHVKKEEAARAALEEKITTHQARSDLHTHQ